MVPQEPGDCGVMLGGLTVPPCAVQIFNHGWKILKNFTNTLRSSPY